MNHPTSQQIRAALRTTTTLAGLRAALIIALADTCDVDAEAPTVRSIPDYSIPVSVDLSDVEPDSAPSVPVDSELGKEYGG